MGRPFISLLLSITLISLFGCGRKDTVPEQAQQPMSIEDLSKLKSQDKTEEQVKGNLSQADTAVRSEIINNLPPAGPYKPTVQEIQNALKNAGLYYATVDGKIGPITKQSIEEFQKANGLKVDGKVGPKTWDVLSKYLNSDNKDSLPAANKKR